MAKLERRVDSSIGVPSFLENPVEEFLSGFASTRLKIVRASCLVCTVFNSLLGPVLVVVEGVSVSFIGEFLSAYGSASNAAIC